MRKSHDRKSQFSSDGSDGGCCLWVLSISMNTMDSSDRVRRFEKKFAECDNMFCKISVSIR